MRYNRSLFAVTDLTFSWVYIYAAMAAVLFIILSFAIGLAILVVTELFACGSIHVNGHQPILDAPAGAFVAA